MLDAVLRVFAEKFDVGAFLQKHPLSVQVQPYSKGQADILGNPNSHSGFDALLSEHKNPSENINQVQRFLMNNEAVFDELKVLKVNCILDIGYGINPSEDSATPVLLQPELLGICSRLQIAVEFSAYPDTGEGF